jgi:hypothetical protein
VSRFDLKSNNHNNNTTRSSSISAMSAPAYTPFGQGGGVAGSQGDLHRLEIASLLHKLAEFSPRDVERVFRALAEEESSDALVSALQLSHDVDGSSLRRVDSSILTIPDPVSGLGGAEFAFHSEKRGGIDLCVCGHVTEIVAGEDVDNFWNEEFQQILERPAVTRDQIVDRAKQIDEISRK